jgi:FkbM family methyltransferase
LINRILDFLMMVARKAARACELTLMRVKLALNGPEVSVDGIRLLVPAGVLSTHMRHRLLKGGPDGEDRRLLPRYARPGDLVVNAGSGCGLSAMAAYRAVQPGGTVIAIEADPAIAELARRNFELNGMASIHSHAAAVVADRGTREVVFYRKKNYFGSNLLHLDGVGQPINVPGVYLPDVVPADGSGRKILLCDIEGYEATLLAVPQIIDCFDLIIVELHFRWASRNVVSPYVRMFDTLAAGRFKIVDLDDEGFVFARSMGSGLDGERIDQAGDRIAAS